MIVDTSTLSHIWWLSPYILSLQTIPECTVISFGKRLIIQNETLMNFKQLCQIWTCKSIQQNVRFECQTISENIHKLKQGLSSTSLQIQGHSRTWIFVFKFEDIQVLYKPCNFRWKRRNFSSIFQVVKFLSIGNFGCSVLS